MPAKGTSAQHEHAADTFEKAKNDMSEEVKWFEALSLPILPILSTSETTIFQMRR